MSAAKWIGLGIGLLALACRAPWAMQPRTVRWDEPDYLILASNFLHGDGYQVFGTPELTWPPVAPALGAVALAAGVPVDYALPLWHVLLGALACVLLFGLARAVTGDVRVAAIAGILAAAASALAVWPLYWGSLTESVFLVCLLTGLWATWRVLHGGRIWAALGAGCAFGIGYLTRPESLLWWGMLLVIVALQALRGHISSAQRWRWAPVLAFTLGFIVWAAPYVGYLHHHTGRWMLSSKTGINVLMSPVVIAQGGAGQDYAARLDSTGAEVLWLSPERFDVDWVQIILADPVALLRQIWANLKLAGVALLDPLLGRSLLVLIPLGLLGNVWDRRRWRQEMFWILALAPLTVLFVTKIETRYLVPVIPVALVWVARAVLHLGQWLEDAVRRATAFQASPLGTVVARRLPAAVGRAAQRPFGPILSGLLVALLLLAAIRGQFQVARAGQAGMVPSHEAAGLWLAEHAEPGAPVMSRNTEVALYADRPVVAFPAAAWEDVLAYARARNVRYLVTDNWELTRLRPQLGFLLEPDRAPAELEYLISFRDDLRITLIYQIID